MFNSKDKGEDVDLSVSKNISTVFKSSYLFFSKMYSQVCLKKNENVVFSPLSIFSLLSMAMGGGEGNTKNEFEKVLVLNEKKGCHDKVGKVLNQLNKSKNLAIAMGVFLNQGFSLEKEYVKLVKEKYKSRIEAVNFPGDEKKVNDFVKKNTKGHIKEIVSVLDSNTVCVLINAIYFQDDWKNQFNVTQTKKNYTFQSFGKKISVQMMTRRKSTELYGIHKINGISFKSCTLPYKGNDFDMIFIKLEKSGEKYFETFEKKVITDSSFLDKIKKERKEKKLKILSIPK